MRILMIASWFPSRLHTTLGNFVQRHVEAIAMEHEVVVLCCFRSPEAKGVEIVQTNEQGVTIYRVYADFAKWQIAKAFAVFEKGLQAIIRDDSRSFDLIHHHVIYPAGIWAARLAHRWQLPLVVTEHWTIYNRQLRQDQPFWLRSISKYVAQRAAMICPVSLDLQQTMVNYGLKSNYQVIPNVVDGDLFQIGEPEAGFHFLHISSLEDRHKNIQGILRTWRSVIDKLPNAVLHIGGDGPHLMWSAYATELGIASHQIYFFGECSAEEVAHRMATAHCFLMFSRFENLPVVIVEAMASGLPVISSHVGGISEHINAQRGMLVKSEDESQLAAALVGMVALWPRYNRYEIRRYALEHFSKAAIAKKYSHTYQVVLQTRQKSD
jgi:L-malate glycosyltransferase